jgi:hypothetical protein
MLIDDWVRVLNLLGSIVLFYGSFRGQQWAKTQARLEDRAALQPREPLPKGTFKPPTEDEDPASAGTQAAFDRAAAEVASRPYFDRPAYILFCIGFAIAALAALIDMYSHGTIARLLGLSGSLH